MQKPSMLRRVVGIGAAVVAVGAVAMVLLPAAVFASDGSTAATEDSAPDAGGDARHQRLTDEQRACLREQGIERRDVRSRRFRVPTDEERQALRDAAEACGIELPEGPELLTDEQRACLEEHGITGPEGGAPRLRFRSQDEREARVQELRDAAEACGIELPLRGGTWCDGPMGGRRERGGRGADDAQQSNIDAAA